MNNPNKVHTVDKVLVIKNVLSEKPKKKTIEVLITQIKPDGQTSELYRIKSILPLKNGLYTNMYELCIYAPHITKDKTPYIKRETEILNMDYFIKEVVKQFKNGHLYINAYNKLPAEGCYHYKLTYRQVKFMLNFEHKAARFPDSLDKAIEKGDPLLIGLDKIGLYHSLDCGEYIIHSYEYGIFYDYHKYSCSTFNEPISKWIENVRSVN